MNKERLVIFIWGCVTVVFISFYVFNMLSNTITTWTTSGGTKISFDGAGIAELGLIICCYYLTKHLISKGETKQ